MRTVHVHWNLYAKTGIEFAFCLRVAHTNNVPLNSETLLQRVIPVIQTFVRDRGLHWGSGPPAGV